MEGKDLFKHIRSSKGDYDVQAHLAEMIALLGPPPKELLDREKLWSDIKWDNAVLNSDSKLCHTAREYFGGPFFNSEGKASCLESCVKLTNMLSICEQEPRPLTRFPFQASSCIRI